MLIKNIEFIKTVLDLKDLPKDGLFEVALAGRSNVGKSSFINALGNNKSLARTSKKPGKTITLNFYLVNKAFYLVDMPGYGYARRNDSSLKDFSKATEKYVTNRNELKGFIMIVDSRTVTIDDKAMRDFLISNDVPFVVLLSKIDKLKRNDIKKRTIETAKYLEIDEKLVIPFSSLTKENMENVALIFDNLLSV